MQSGKRRRVVNRMRHASESQISAFDLPSQALAEKPDGKLPIASETDGRRACNETVRLWRYLLPYWIRRLSES
jgi:hypothetical protein